MGGLIVRRMLSLLPTLAGIIVVTFLMTRALPGDPAAYFAGPAATSASIAETRARLGLDRSLAVQFWVYLRDLAQGDLGTSLLSGQPVLVDLEHRLPASLEITLAALFVAIGAGIPLGVRAAIAPGGRMDRLCTSISLVGQAVPTFFLGLVLVFIFYFLLNWAPAPIGRLDVVITPPREITGFWSIDALLAGNLRLAGHVLAQMILPVITLAAFGLGPIARMTRASMIEILSSEFIRTFRAAGLPRNMVIWRYAFRNAAIPVLNTSAMVFSFLLGANVLVEKVFGWPGVGAYAIEAVLASDFAPVQGFVATMAVFYIVVNLAVDVIAMALDPAVQFDV